MTRQTPGRAFTLVELLVVVSIITVLLALLTPALDRAIYQAELTTCGAKLKGISTATLAYAVANARCYPATDDPNLWDYQPALIGTADGSYSGDRRKVWKQAVGSINKAFSCPLTNAK